MVRPNITDEDIEMEENVEIDKNEFILNHVVLPRYLPPAKQEYKEQLKLVHLMLKIVISTKTLPINTIRLFHRLKEIYIDTTDDTMKDILSKQIKSLRSDDTFAMFVRRQNCTLIIHRKLETIILGTFHSDVKPIEVYKHCSDVEVKTVSLNIFKRNKKKIKFNTNFCIFFSY